MKKKQRMAWTHGEIQFLVPVAAAKPRHAYAHAHAYMHARPAASWPIVHIPAYPSVTAVPLNYGVFARQAPVITATGHAIGFFVSIGGVQRSVRLWNVSDLTSQLRCRLHATYLTRTTMLALALYPAGCVLELGTHRARNEGEARVRHRQHTKLRTCVCVTVRHSDCERGWCLAKMSTGPSAVKIAPRERPNMPFPNGTTWQIGFRCRTGGAGLSHDQSRDSPTAP